MDDRKPVEEMAKELFGKLYGDIGYVPNVLASKLFDQDVELITNGRKNMKPRAIALWDKLMLRKRFIIETVNDQLKNIIEIEHSRYRSTNGFMLNLINQNSYPALRFFNDNITNPILNLSLNFMSISSTTLSDLPLIIYTNFIFCSTSHTQSSYRNLKIIPLNIHFSKALQLIKQLLCPFSFRKLYRFI